MAERTQFLGAKNSEFADSKRACLFHRTVLSLQVFLAALVQFGHQFVVLTWMQIITCSRWVFAIWKRKADFGRVGVKAVFVRTVGEILASSKRRFLYKLLQVDIGVT